ncbi:family 16 glycoside hydrolase [Bremerella alba]|uniref:Cytochrome c domain-containing protein n=1 Tax=Bremerella alba TaxID=980252 RepID=A0A7V8V2K4_9BACT|nr:family 16 glycoside hydrolase [Bremerella alba]MBA2113651.1 hypothetical protein [Bremerella alba]
MTTFYSRVLLSLTFVLATGSSLLAADERYQVLFNGKDLSGWKGLDKFWSVQDGTIIGETTSENPTSGNTFLIWQGPQLGDFEFRGKVRFQGNNSGVQYRSEIVDADNYVLKGYQADLHPRQEYFGMLYGEKTGRGIIATRGQQVVISEDGKKKVTSQVGDSELLTDDDWNDVHIVAVGNRLIHQINGITTVDVTDKSKQAMLQGALGLQLHAGPPMKVEFRNLLLRQLKGDEAQAVLSQAIKSGTPNDKSASVEPTDVAPQSSEAWLTSQPIAKWIWSKNSPDGHKLNLRKTFEVSGKVKAARLYATCDNSMKLMLNGKPIKSTNQWQTPIELNITQSLKPGNNVLAVAGENEGGIAAMVLKLVVELTDGTKQTIVTDESWKISDSQVKDWEQVAFDDTSWNKPTIKGKLGDGPWRIPNYTSQTQKGEAKDPLNPKNILTAPGFVVDHIYTVPKEQGSWVSLTTDPQGRFYACDQGGAGLFRITVREDYEPLIEPVSVDALKSISGIQGMIWAFDSLWVHRNGGHLYRLTDSNGDDKLDTAETIPGGTGGGEHGNHAVIVTEDGSDLYLDGGNHAPLGKYKNTHVATWDEDLLLPRMWDANGHARGKLAPGGWMTRLNVDTKDQTVYTIGFRNQYDIDKNRFGDVFTFDADMEWDLGLPWYRPTRICHVASGADYGWRSGSGKWPAYYEDSVPPVVDIGPGSPTGVVSGKGTAFPTRYQDAIFALDWTFGTIYAIHLKPHGASYQGEAEPFTFGSPLPVTDAIVGHDGALYFTIGGRGTQSALFRVRYIGDESLEAPSEIDPAAAEARTERRQLEAFHGIEAPAAVEFAWPFLSSKDRFLRNAARAAIESQPVETWSASVLSEQNPQAHVTAAVALARMGNQDHRAPQLASLLKMDAKSLDKSELLGLLRAYSLTYIRLGSPTESERTQVIAQLDPLLPAGDPDINTELIRVLTYLRADSVIAKTMMLIEKRSAPEIPDWSTLATRNARYGGTVNSLLSNHPPTRELGYAFILRNMRSGWTLNQRKAYFTFLNEAAKASGGASYPGYLTRIRDEALGNSTDAERKALEGITGEDFNPVPDFPIAKIEGPGKQYTLDSAMAAVRGKPNFERGRSLFFSSTCGKCHRLGTLGGSIGPDLTSIPHKFDQRYLVEAIVDPSKNISDQYGSSIVLLDSGRVITGLLVENDEEVTIYPNEPNADPVKVSRDEIEDVQSSPVSQMPKDLLNPLNPEEVRDLINYLMASGNPNDKRYRQGK